MSFWDLVVSNRRGLNALRLILALLVLYSHMSPIGLGQSDPRWPGIGPTTSYGGLAVGAFFAISGLLVTNSAINRPTHIFLINRIFRIFPGYFLVLLFGTLVVGPIVYFQEGLPLKNYLSAEIGGPLTFLTRNLFMPVGLQFGINNVFSDLPFPNAIIGSLWSLPIEVRAYLVAMFIGILAKYIAPLLAVVLCDLVLLAYLVLQRIQPELSNYIFPGWITVAPNLLVNFLVGGTVAILAKNFKSNGVFVFLTVGVFIVSEIFGGEFFLTFGIGCLAIILPIISNLLKLSRFKILENDISYGVYLFAFPVQQLVVYYFPTMNFFRQLVASVLFTIFLAVLSWIYVERPFINLGNSIVLREKNKHCPQ